MPDPTGLEPAESSRSVRFVKFLREAVAIKTKRVFEVQQYPSVIWFADLPKSIQEVRSPLIEENWPQADLSWLKVARMQEQARPAAPEICLPWLLAVDLDSPTTTPVLNEMCEERDSNLRTVRVPPSPDAQQVWDQYLAKVWTPWASKTAIARQVKPVYQRLFAIYQQMQAAADNFDLLLGVGLFHSRTDPEQPFRRHLLAFSAELSLDDRTGVMSVGPSANFTSAKVEADFFPVGDRSSLQSQIDSLQPQLESAGAGFGPVDRDALGVLITQLITPISAVTRYVPNLRPADAGQGGALVSFGAALILRPRSTRSLEALLEHIESQTKGTEPRFSIGGLPVPWRKMVEDGTAWERASAQHDARSDVAPKGRVYFPLPSNEEQSRIVRKAEGSPGVVVQGPPGTGKSHTIANLISHYLAMGRRVLVTAQSPQALEVLHDKMPKELQQLCITLLGNSRASDRALRGSVDAILSRQQDYCSTDYDKRIQELEQKLTASETRVNNLERTLHQSRLGETEVTEPVTGYRGTRADIARQLRDERSVHMWLRDAVRNDTVCPTYPSGWDALATYHSGLNADVRATLGKELISLPFAAQTAIDAIKSIAAAKVAVNSFEVQNHVKVLPRDTGALELQALGHWLRKLLQIESSASPESLAWLSAIRKVMLRDTSLWESRLDECQAALRPLTSELLNATVKVVVNGRGIAEARRDLMRLGAHYSGGGVRRTFWGGKPPVVKETDWVEQAVSIEGLAVQTLEDIERAGQALAGWAALEAATMPWQQWPPDSQGLPQSQAARLRYRFDLLKSLLEIGADGKALSSSLRDWLVDSLGAATSTHALLAAADRRIAEIVLAAAREQRDALVGRLRQAVGNRDVVPAPGDLIDALITERADLIPVALGCIQSEAARRQAHKPYSDYLTSVRKAAPMLADDIVASEGTPGFRPTIFALEAAWQHHRAHEWLETMLSKERIEATHKAVRDERQRQQEILAELTSERAWNSALARISDLQRATLTSWAKAVAAIPQTGKSIFAKRANAQRLLGECLSSIPAWVVSLSRLYETVEPLPGLFDVAIVDEASQCWVDSLVLFYLAKQVIIVGDDKQISPTVVGVADAQIDDLARAFLPDFRFRSNFTMTSSLFDHGRTYLSDGVPLREHFRCVPEIIGFSNALCYSGNLIPLRQVGKNRLPPLRRTYLPNGLRLGDVNEGEARAIVDTIVTCNEDPNYEDADFGVVCLQGNEQGELIEQLLLDRLGPEVFMRRHLRCGNPYAFQGDERDVMFMSMVAAPNQPHQTLTAAMYEQRFNVAMSRARDQVWLFHSVKEDEVGANCLRRRVLDYFMNPPDPTIGGSLLNVPKLQLAAQSADRVRERAPVPFDSWFEVDVALALVAKGYALTAQVRVAHKKIDLVVEGDDGVRLAVECDGDAWHGIDQYDADLARQRQLERAGWRFVRVRECLFYSDEERAVREVVDACLELDIVPDGGQAKESTSSLVAPTVAVKPVLPPDSRQDVSAQESTTTQLEDDDIDVSGISDPTSDVPRTTVTPERDYPDPRTAPVSNVSSAVLEIITAHGPLTKMSIYNHYRDGCPRLERVGKNLRHAVNSTLSALKHLKRVEARDEGRNRLTTDVVYRLPDQPWTQARPLLGRDLDDVPLSELAGEILSEGGHTLGRDGDALEMLLKSIARRYGALRFREQARERLTAAADLAFDTERIAAIGGLH